MIQLQHESVNMPL